MFGSYPKPFKILLNPLRQLGGVLVDVLDFDVDVAEGLFKVEIVIDFRRGDADVAAGREAPVGDSEFLLLSRCESTAFHERGRRR